MSMLKSSVDVAIKRRTARNISRKKRGNCCHCWKRQRLVGSSKRKCLDSV